MLALLQIFAGQLDKIRLQKISKSYDIFKSGELQEKSTTRKIRVVQKEGNCVVSASEKIENA